MGVWRVHSKLTDFPFDLSKYRNSYPRRWEGTVARNQLGSRGANSFGLSGMFALSAFDMGHTPARAARPLVGWTARGIGIGISPCTPSFPFYNEILATAFGVVVFSVVAQGLTMPLLMRKLKFYDGNESIRRQP